MKLCLVDWGDETKLITVPDGKILMGITGRAEVSFSDDIPYVQLEDRDFGIEEPTWDDLPKVMDKVQERSGIGIRSFEVIVYTPPPDLPCKNEALFASARRQLVDRAHLVVRFDSTGKVWCSKSRHARSANINDLDSLALYFTEHIQCLTGKDVDPDNAL